MIPTSLAVWALAITAASASLSWDPELVSVHVSWSVNDPAAASRGDLSLHLYALFSHNLTAPATGSVASATLDCDGVTARADLFVVEGPIAAFHARRSLREEGFISPPASCRIVIEVEEWALVSSWTGSPVREHLEIDAPYPCASAPTFKEASGVEIEGAEVLCELSCGRGVGHSSALVVHVVEDTRDTAPSGTDDTSEAFAELESGVDQIPGLSEILKIAMKVLMPPVIDPFLEKLNDHFTHTITGSVAKDVVGNVPKDTVALLEPDLRRNLTALLTDSVPAALTPRLVDRLTKTVAPPLTDQLVASLEADLPERLLRSLHARTAAPLLVTLPDRLKRSLLTSLTHTLSHTLPHVLVPSIGEALLAQGVAAAAAMGGGSFPIPLSEACATCPHNPAVKDKSACWACRRDEFRYWVLHQSHYHTDYYSTYYRSYYSKAAERAYADVPLKEGGSHPTSNDVAGAGT